MYPSECRSMGSSCPPPQRIDVGNDQAGMSLFDKRTSDFPESQNVGIWVVILKYLPPCPWLASFHELNDGLTVVCLYALRGKSAITVEG